jgi:transcriptional regulator with XRE-family HTH domain
MKIDGKEVKAIRKKAGKGTAELAVAADMSAAWILKLESSESHEVNEHVAKAMAQFLGVKVKELEVKA